MLDTLVINFGWEILYSDYSKQANPIIEGVSLSLTFDIILHIIDKDYFNGGSEHWLKMKDSLAEWNIFHLASEQNNAYVAVKLVESFMKEG
jgi:hypothetical protein